MSRNNFMMLGFWGRPEWNKRAMPCIWEKTISSLGTSKHKAHEVMEHLVWLGRRKIEGLRFRQWGVTWRRSGQTDSWGRCCKAGKSQKAWVFWMRCKILQGHWGCNEHLVEEWEQSEELGSNDDTPGRE